VPQEEGWGRRFAVVAATLQAALGADAVAIEHVGSTAVPGLAGKPVLDLAVAVLDVPAAERCVAPLQSLGYRYRGHNGVDVRRHYFVRDVQGVRTVQIHLYVLPATGWNDALRFRDALRADSALAAAYAAEKYRVADAVGWDKAAYAVAKGGFVERVLAGRVR
jgi:GrpB-like predicted nucleotidyltransferase (UPF0157 family)